MRSATRQNWTMTLAAMLALTSAAAAEAPRVGVYGGTNPATMNAAAEHGVDVLFPSVRWYDPNDFLGRLVDTAHQHGMKVYPSLAMAHDGHGEEHHAFAQAHPEFWEKYRDGRTMNKDGYIALSWGYDEVRAFKVRTVADLVERSGVDGVLLDYTRFFGTSTGYSDAIVEAFRKEHGRDPLAIPADDEQWVRFRAGYVTRFVGELRAALDEIDENIQILACVNPDPNETLHHSMQDWATWLDRGYIDGVVTMIYARNTNHILADVRTANAAIDGRVPHMPMIAPYGNNLTTPGLIREASHKCLATGTGGVAFYRSDSIFNHDLWPAIGEVAAWELETVADRPVNYVLNAGFERELEQWAAQDSERATLATDQAHEGQAALKLAPAGELAVRQLVNEALPAGQAGVAVSAWVRSDDARSPLKGAIEVTVNYTNGEETVFRIPAADALASQSWQRVEATLPLVNREALNFLSVGFAVEGQSGAAYLDDVRLTFTDQRDGDAPANYRVVNQRPVLNNADERNLALGQLTFGSSFWSNGFEYANAVDGDLSSDNNSEGAAWHSQRPGKDQWLKIYLPEPRRIERVRLLNSSLQRAYRTREYQIAVSRDDRTYRVVAQGTLPDDGATWTDVEIEPVIAKYVKFVGVTGYNLDYTVGLKEIELY